MSDVLVSCHAASRMERGETGKRPLDDFGSLAVWKRSVTVSSGLLESSAIFVKCAKQCKGDDP